MGICTAFLRSGKELSESERDRVADLLELHGLRKKKGRQRIPLYDVSASEILLSLAVDAVRANKSPSEEVLRGLEGCSVSRILTLKGRTNFGLHTKASADRLKG